MLVWPLPLLLLLSSAGADEAVELDRIPPRNTVRDNWWPGREHKDAFVDKEDTEDKTEHLPVEIEEECLAPVIVGAGRYQTWSLFVVLELAPAVLLVVAKWVLDAPTLLPAHDVRMQADLLSTTEDEVRNMLLAKVASLWQ